MMHFSCDLCGKDIRPDQDQRFIVTMEVRPGYDPNQITDADLEPDNLEAISQELCSLPEGELPYLENLSKSLRFDLCDECRDRFLRDPLGRDHAQKLSFSEN